MRTTLSVLALAGLFSAAASLAVAREEKKEPIARGLPTKDLKLANAEGSVKKPTVVTSDDELAKAVPDKDSQAAIKKHVDFTKQQLLIFAWSGSGGDKLGMKINETKKGPEVVFVYQAGATDDLRQHFHLWALRKDANWKVEDAKARAH